VALLATQSLVNAGTPPTFATMTASDTFNISENSFLLVRNSHSAAVTVTVVTPGTLGTGAAYPDVAVVVGAGTGTDNEIPTEAWIPILRDYASSSTGLGTVTTSIQNANIKAAVITL
jgi:hypothetical protein